MPLKPSSPLPIAGAVAWRRMVPLRPRQTVEFREGLLQRRGLAACDYYTSPRREQRGNEKWGQCWGVVEIYLNCFLQLFLSALDHASL